MKMTFRSHATTVALLIAFVATQGSRACYNEPPVACISPWVLHVPLGGRIQLDGTGSYDPDGYIVNWYWEYPSQAYNTWGQGTSRFACNIDAAGVYGFALDVTDNDGAMGWDVATAYVVGVNGIQYNDPDFGWTSFGLLYVHLGTTVDFKAVPGPDTSWPSGKPVWGGTAGASGTGSTKSVQFNTLSTSPTDYKTVIVECGNTVVVRFSHFTRPRRGQKKPSGISAELWAKTSS